MLRASTYPIAPLPAIVAIWLESFVTMREREDNDSLDIDMQRIITMYEGSFDRVRRCGSFDTHAEQASALLATIQELDAILDGGLGTFSVDGMERSWRDNAVHRALTDIRGTLIKMLSWHFDNGAGALLPIAIWLGLAPAAEKLACRASQEADAGEGA